jgi:hypothetical protein
MFLAARCHSFAASVEATVRTEIKSKLSRYLFGKDWSGVCVSKDTFWGTASWRGNWFLQMSNPTNFTVSDSGSRNGIEARFCASVIRGREWKGWYESSTRLRWQFRLCGHCLEERRKWRDELDNRDFWSRGDVDD